MPTKLQKLDLIRRVYLRHLGRKFYRIDNSRSYWHYDDDYGPRPWCDGRVGHNPDGSPCSECHRRQLNAWMN